MCDFASDLRSLSLQSQRLIEALFEKQKKCTSWVNDYVKLTKDILNQNSFASVEGTPKPSPKQVQNKTFVCEQSNAADVAEASECAVTAVLTTPRRSSGHNDQQICNKENERSPVLSPVNIQAVETPLQVKKDSLPKSSKSVKKIPAHQRVLAASKASKHRSSFNRSLVTSCQKPAGKSKALRSTREKQDCEDAVAKKQALLKMKAEEQKRKREMKMERNLQARQQLEREAEERLRKTELQREERRATGKCTEKIKKEIKNKKRKPETNTDANVAPGAKTAKVNVINQALLAKPATNCPEPTATALEQPQQAEKQLNKTYVAENKENSESYTMTPQVKETSYTNYDMSDLRPSDESDDDEPKKPVPAWATGIRLKEALIKQYYKPPNIKELFPEIYIPPDETFGMIRKKKIERSSSAIWNTPMRPC